MSDICAKYNQIKEHVEHIAKECNRDPDTITIIAVSKGHPFSEIQRAYEAGCRNFGENRIGEAEEKWSLIPSDVNRHFIGSLQKNKVRKVLGLNSLIHSVDSLELAEKFSVSSVENNKISSILLQANTSGEYSKHGLSPEQWEEVYEQALRLPGIKIEGWMTMAPLVEDQSIIHSCFAALRKLNEKLGPLPHLSMGMSHDYPIAIQEGATLLRIGTAIFGNSLSN